MDGLRRYATQKDSDDPGGVARAKLPILGPEIGKVWESMVGNFSVEKVNRIWRYNVLN